MYLIQEFLLIKNTLDFNELFEINNLNILILHYDWIEEGTKLILDQLFFIMNINISNLTIIVKLNYNFYFYFVRKTF